MLRRYTPFLTLTILCLAPAPRAGAAACAGWGAAAPTSSQQQPRPIAPAPAISGYDGKVVQSIQLPAVPERDRNHLLQLLPLKAGQPLTRDQVRESIRILYATGRFSDIQAEVTPSGDGVVLTFVTWLNFFIGSVEAEGAPGRPNTNQVINASK